MKTKISYILLSALTLSLITGITPASAKPMPSKPAAPVAYKSPPAPAPVAKAAPAPVVKAAAAIPAVIAKPPVAPPTPKITAIPALLANFSSPVTAKATATPSYSTFSYSGPTSTPATTTKAVQPKIETIPTIKTSLPKIGSPLMAYDFIPSTSTGSKTDLNAVSSLSGNNTSSTVAQDFIKTSLIAKPSTDIKKTSTAADLTKIMTTTGLSTATLLGGKVTTYTPGQTIEISKKITTNTQYNSTDKINTTANQNEILKNVNAVTSKGLNTLLIQATADSTGKADYNLGLSQLRAETDLKNYATTMEKNGYSAKDGQWKNEAGVVVSASSCTKICTYTLKGESSPTIQLVAKGLGEVTTKSPGALGEIQAQIVAQGCSNSRAGSCAALHDKQRVTLIGGVFDSTLIKEAPAKPTTGTTTTCVERGDCPPPRTTCAERGDCPPPICTVNCGTETGGTTTTVNPRTTTTTVNPGTTTTTVNPGTTTTSRLPSAGGVTGGSASTPTLPSGAGSTTSSGPSSGVSTGTPTSGVGSSSGPSSSGSTLLPPASGFGSTPTTGGSTSTPTTTGGSTSNPTPAPKFKVS